MDLKINSGENAAIMGPSGSGKTSLMMLVGGLEAPTAGTIRVCGQDITPMGEDALARFRAEHIGIVFQSFHLIPTMTALENVAVPLEFKDRADARQMAAEALEAMGLKDRMHHTPSELSGGEQQRVAIARAFVTKPKLLLADEPTGNLDEQTGKDVMDLLIDLHKTHHTTLLLITHDPAIAKRCDRVINIKNGRIA
ncbi:MAG: ABC transporter ATP-binding protein [Alphaproteobacteria bacterium]